MVVDPLDGTINFLTATPLFSVSVALLHKDKIIAGVVYNPIYDELFTAGIGLGVLFHGEKMHISNTPSLDKSLLATGFAYDRRSTRDNNYAQFCNMTNLTHGVRRAGSAALDLAYVARGRLMAIGSVGLTPGTWPQVRFSSLKLAAWLQPMTNRLLISGLRKY